MADSILVATHGMGKHTPESIKEKVENAADIALKRYPSYQNKSFKDYVEVKPIGYDDIFEDERKRIVASNKPVSTYFQSAGNLPSLFIENIVKLEAAIGEDNFYTTHALDVLLYASSHGERVRLRMLEKLCDYMADKGDASFHVMAHSLGTAAMHDTLHKAYTGGITDEHGKRYALNTVTHKLDSLWMVANVSRLMYVLNPIRTTRDPKDTVVKPGSDDGSCTQYLYNIRHVIDPFTKFFPFDPQPDDSWVHPDDYEDFYRYIVTRKIGEAINPHDLAGYIMDPAVAYKFLKRVMPAGSFNPPRAEVIETHNNVRNLVGELREISEYVSEIHSVSDFSTFLKMVKEFQEYIEKLIEQVRQ